MGVNSVTAGFYKQKKKSVKIDFLLFGAEGRTRTGTYFYG